MRYFLSVGFLLIGVLALSGCLTDKGELTEDAPPGFCDSLNATYVDTMKIIIDQNCANASACHGSGSFNGDFTSFTNMQDAGFLSVSKIGIQVSSGEMPPTGLLPDSVKVIFQCWADAVFPQQ